MGYFLCPIFALLLCAMSKLEGKASFFFSLELAHPPAIIKRKKNWMEEMDMNTAGREKTSIRTENR
jgi:hypothetical protein